LQIELCHLLREAYKGSAIKIVPEYYYQGPDFSGSTEEIGEKLITISNDKDCKCDIMVIDEDSKEAIALELKYKTVVDKDDHSRQEVSFDSSHPKGFYDLNKYHLTNQRAPDDGSLFILEDFYRLQYLLNNKLDDSLNVIKCYSINIINDELYWNMTTGANKGKVDIFWVTSNLKTPWRVKDYHYSKKYISFEVEVPDGFYWYEYSKAIGCPTFNLLCVEFSLVGKKINSKCREFKCFRLSDMEDHTYEDLKEKLNSR
jgi:hypothetical protein